MIKLHRCVISFVAPVWSPPVCDVCLLLHHKNIPWCALSSSHPDRNHLPKGGKAAKTTLPEFHRAHTTALVFFLHQESFPYALPPPAHYPAQGGKQNWANAAISSRDFQENVVLSCCTSLGDLSSPIVSVTSDEVTLWLLHLHPLGASKQCASQKA